MKQVVFAAILVIFFACKNREASPVNTDSARLMDRVRQEDSSSIFSNNVTTWLNTNLQTPAAHRKITLEEHWEADTLPAEDFSISDYFLDTYKTVLRWSPDSTYLLDIGSYGTVVVKDRSGRIQLEAGEPDTELALIEPAKNERKRLMFVGPASTIINGKWLNATDAIILGTFRSESGVTDTLMWLIDARENLFRLYNLKTEK